MLITVAMGFMYGGYRVFDEDSDVVCTGQILFTVGICLYFLASTSLSAGMAPVFKKVRSPPSYEYCIRVHTMPLG